METVADHRAVGRCLPRGRGRRLLPGAACALLPVALLAGQALAQPPADFHLIAAAGGIPPWAENRSVEVFADGTGACFRTASQDKKAKPMRKTARLALSATEVQRLADAVDASGFFALDEEHASDAVDGTFATLIVTARGTKHQVTTDNTALPAFDGIMVLINTLVPPRCRLAYNEIFQ